MKRPQHLERVRQLPCAVCLNPIETEAAHVRFSDARIGKTNPGGKKPDDKFTVPLCSRHHREQHQMGDERAFWDKYNRDPILLALAIYAADDHEEAERIVIGGCNGLPSTAL